MKHSWFVLVFWLAAVLSACSHVQIVHEAELEKIAPEQSGVIFPVLLSSDDPTPIASGCQIELRTPGGMIDYPIDLKPGKQLIFAALPEGVYRYQDIFCFGRRWTLTSKGWPNFKSQAGQVGIVDPVEFKITDMNLLSTHAGNRKETQVELQALFGRLSEPVRKRVVDAYNGLPVTAAMVQELPPYGDHEIRKTSGGRKLGGTEAKTFGFPKFKACYSGEDWVNYLWIGNVRLRAHYHAGKLEVIEPLESLNTFSPHFRECAKATITEFEPKKSAPDLWYDFYL